MPRKYCLAGIFILSILVLHAQKKNDSKGYRFTIDLLHVDNDKIKVELITPLILKKSIVYHLPKIVPGTYSEDDYGRYVEQFKAFDQKGTPCRSKKRMKTAGQFPMQTNCTGFLILSMILMMTPSAGRRFLNRRVAIFKRIRFM
jgi:hypothetical protein